MRSLWASVEPRPLTQKRVHYVLAVLWFLFFFVILHQGWENSVPLLVFISVYANFVGHISSAQAAQVEVRQEAQEQREDEAEDADFAKIERKVDDLHQKIE